MRDTMSDQVEAIREIVPGLFRIIVQIPIPEVGSVNSYVILDRDRNLIIDPGMAHAASCEIMEKAIQDLGVDLERTDFFITHHHLDHFGSVCSLLRSSSRIYISGPEARFINRIASGEVEAEIGKFLEVLGFPEKEPVKLVSQFYGEGFRLERPWPFQCVADGDVIVRGGRTFTCLVAPGHSIAHGCLYESGLGILITGDQITAGIQFIMDRTNPLADHFQTLDRIRDMDAKHILPGHGSPIRDHRRRIDYLRTHYQERLESTRAVLREDREDGKDAYAVTLALDEKFADRDPINLLPLVMRFIHTRHTYAYLLHLVAQGYAGKERRHGRDIFFPCQPPAADRANRESPESTGAGRR